MSDTPETDAETMQDEWDHVDTDFGPFAPSTMVSAEFARQLERERNQLREIVEQRLLAGAEIHQRANDLLRMVRMLEEQRDEAHKIIEQLGQTNK